MFFFFWNLKLSGGLCSLCLPVAGEVDMCERKQGAPSSEARPSILPVQLPEAWRLSVPDLTRTERKRDHWQKGDFFYPSPLLFFSLLARLTECLPPSRFTEESNYSLGLNLATFRRQPTDKGSRLREQSVDQHFSLSSKKWSGFQWWLWRFCFRLFETKFLWFWVVGQTKSATWRWHIVLYKPAMAVVSNMHWWYKNYLTNS